MTKDDLDRLEEAALTCIRIKTENAQKGNDWVVDSHSLTSHRLLELVALARRGYMNNEETEINRQGLCQNDACHWHRKGRHRHPEDGTINSNPVFE